MTSAATAELLASFTAEQIPGEMREFQFINQSSDIFIRPYNLKRGWYGDSTFFERANLPYIVEAMEDYFDEDRRADRDYIQVQRGKDDFAISSGSPDKADKVILIIISNARSATIDGLHLRSWDIAMQPETALRLKDELKKLV